MRALYTLACVDANSPMTAYSSYSSLTRAMAEALVDVLWFVDGCEDDQMDPDDAVKVLEGVAHLVTQLSSKQRIEFTELLDAMAAEEPNPSRRAFLEGFPEGFGLLEEDNGT